MRTAEEIITSSFVKPEDENEMLFTFSDIIELINEARKECIEECATVAKAFPLKMQNATIHPPIDIQSILSLIKELK